ncbi:SGNH/GDSL hydrolase family protein [Bacillus sp. AK031]
MYRQKKAYFIIPALLAAGFLLILLFNSSQPIQESVKAQTSVKEQVEETDMEKAAEEEVQPETEKVEESEEKAASFTEEIKLNVREVLEVAVNLFKKDLKIVSIGDSLTQGVGDETESGGYVGILNHTFQDSNLKISIENFGKRGNRTDQLLKRLDNSDIASSVKQADVVLITIGANDIMKIVKNNFTDLKLETFQQEREGYIERLRTILYKINELNPDTKVYLIGFYNPFEGYFGDIKELGMIMDNWNDAGKSVTEEFDNVDYIPIADVFQDTKLQLLAEDYFHPNTSGYKLMAKRIIDYVEEIGIEKDAAEVGNQ